MLEQDKVKSKTPYIDKKCMYFPRGLKRIVETKCDEMEVSFSAYMVELILRDLGLAKEMFL